MLVWPLNLILLALGMAGGHSIAWQPLFALVVAGALLEARPVYVPGYGQFSLAVPFYLCAALTTGLGFAMAAGMAIIGMTLRVFLTNRPTSLKERSLEAGYDLCPVLATALCIQLLEESVSGWARVLVVPELFLVLVAFQKSWTQRRFADHRPIDWTKTDLGMIFPALGQAFAGVAFCLTLQSGIYPFLACLPWLLVLYQAAQGAAIRIALDEQTRLSQELSVAERSLKETAHRAHSQAELLALLEGLNARLSQLKEPLECANAVVATVVEMRSYRSVALFQGGESVMPALAHRSPFSELLKNLPLLELSEPSVEACWRRGKFVQVRPDDKRRIFVDEPYGLCLPLPRFGVLYLGKQSPFSRDELELFTRLTEVAAPALLKASSYRQQNQALDYHKNANQRLQDWVDRLSTLLDGSRTLAASLEPVQLIDQAKEVVGKLVPHDGQVIVCLQPDLGWFPAGAAPDQGALTALIQAVSANRKPLILDDTRTTAHAGLGAAFTSLLVAPLLGPERLLGLIVLGAQKPARFERADLESLMVLSYHLSAMFSNAQAHAEVKDALLQLKASQQQLTQSTKMAAVGQLAAGVAHELNSPLGAILFGLDTCQGLVKEPPPKFVERMERIRKSAIKAQGIISKLLVYSHQGHVSAQSFELNLVVRDAIEMLEHHLQLSSVRLALNLTDSTPVKGHQNELHQVVTNLVLNAKDALESLPSDKRVIEISSELKQDTVELVVSDNGPGIAMEHQAKVFDPFFTTKDVGKGTGLGLSVSHQIVTQHGGSLTVSSAVGQGATFILTLPRAER